MSPKLPHLENLDFMLRLKFLSPVFHLEATWFVCVIMIILFLLLVCGEIQSVSTAATHGPTVLAPDDK
jgi:hypothetical protein